MNATTYDPKQIDLNNAQTDGALKDAVIVITGAGDGIGRAAALDFARAGAHLVLIGRTQSKLEAVYDEIEAISSTQPILLPFDLNELSIDNAQDIAVAIEREFGRLDGLLLNASVLGSKMSIAQYPANQWQEVMQVNLNSAFYLTQGLLPLMQHSENGRIIFTTSSVGRRGRAYWGAYAVSKFATEGLMQTLAEELENTSRIRTHCINPGGTRSNMRALAYPAEDPTKLPLPADHMPFYRYLMSAYSQAYNGISWDARDFLPDVNS